MPVVEISFYAQFFVIYMIFCCPDETISTPIFFYIAANRTIFLTSLPINNAIPRVSSFNTAVHAPSTLNVFEKVLQKIFITNHPPEELVQNPHIFDIQLSIEHILLFHYPAIM